MKDTPAGRQFLFRLPSVPVVGHAQSRSPCLESHGRHTVRMKIKCQIYCKKVERLEKFETVYMLNFCLWNILEVSNLYSKISHYSICTQVIHLVISMEQILFIGPTNIIDQRKLLTEIVIHKISISWDSS